MRSITRTAPAGGGANDLVARRSYQRRRGSAERPEDFPLTANIDPTQAAARNTGPLVKAPAPAGAGNGPFGAALAKAQSADGPLGAPVDAPAPPAELADHIAAAARAWEALSQSGRHVSFSQSPDGRVAIELHDIDDDQTETLSGSSLFDLIDRGGRG
jgi:hypothetical protein